MLTREGFAALSQLVVLSGESQEMMQERELWSRWRRKGRVITMQGTAPPAAHPPPTGKNRNLIQMSWGAATNSTRSVRSTDNRNLPLVLIATFRALYERLSQLLGEHLLGGEGPATGMSSVIVRKHDSIWQVARASPWAGPHVLSSTVSATGLGRALGLQERHTRCCVACLSSDSPLFRIPRQERMEKEKKM